MAGKLKLGAREAFDANMEDARTLVWLAHALTNRRVRRMRIEMRGRIGGVLGIPQRDHAKLDCIESDELFTILKPASKMTRQDLNEKSLRPLLRQAVVAACAAVETFSADRVMERYGAAINASPVPNRLLSLPMTVGHWLEIEGRYKRRTGCGRLSSSK